MKTQIETVFRVSASASVHGSGSHAWRESGRGEGKGLTLLISERGTELRRLESLAMFRNISALLNPASSVVESLPFSTGPGACVLAPKGAVLS